MEVGSKLVVYLYLVVYVFLLRDFTVFLINALLITGYCVLIRDSAVSNLKTFMIVWLFVFFLQVLFKKSKENIGKDLAEVTCLFHDLLWF